MAPATTAELRQQGKQSRPLKLLSQGKGQERFFFWVCFYFFFPLVFLYLGPGPGCQRGFGVSVHSLGSCLILASKLGLQLPCPVVPGEVDGEVDGLVAAAMNWAAA